MSDWFSGNEGFSTVELGYNFADSQNLFSACEIDFVDAFCGGVWEKVHGSVALNIWIYFDVPFASFTNSIKSFELIRGNRFIRAFYLINECFGNGNVKCDVQN
jgi:hypothetical protein